MPPPPRLLCAVLALAACSAGAPAPVTAPPPASRAAPPAPVTALVTAPPRYLVFARWWIERAGDVDRVIVNGGRMEVRGMEITRLGPAEPELDGGARTPPWSPAGAAPYRFWK